MNLAEARRLWREVVVVNAGGTINMRGGAGAAPGRGVAELFERLGADFERKRLRLETPFARPPDSSNVGSDEWACIVNEVRRIDAGKARAWALLEAAGEPPLHRGGVVVAHGTDTMQITSLVVALELTASGLTVPVIFTGSHSPPSEPGSDAVNNLAKAVFAAIRRPEEAPHNLPPGVYVLFGEDIHLASRLSKVRSMPDLDGRYFHSFPGPVAHMTSMDFSVKLDQGLLDVLARQTPPTLVPRRVGPWGYVEHLLVDTFVDPAVLDDLGRRVEAARAAQPRRRCGVVVQGDFSKHPQCSALVAGLLRLARSQVVVALGSRHAWRRLSGHGLGDRILLLPRSLSHSGARTKLSWLLGTGTPVANVGGLLTRSLVGEVFETESLPGWIKYETFPEQRSGVLAVPAWPDLPPAVVGDAARRLLESPRRRGTLHLYGFGYGHLPGPNRPLADLVAAWLRDQLPAAALPDEPPRHPKALVGVLAAKIATLPAADFEAWLSARYAIDPRLANQACQNATAARIQAAAHHSVRDQLRHTIDGQEWTPHGLHPRRVNEALDAFLGELRFRIDPARLAAAAAERLVAAGVEPPGSMAARMRVVAPASIARRILKDAVMASHSLLGEVGRATDAGLRVQMHSLAIRSWSDIGRYEAGTMLLVLGVQAERGDWWRLEGLRPRDEGG